MNNEASIIDNNEKKIIRRDIEKQRRQQMSILCSSLRSLLPFEFIKGKRSTSDHIGEATNYIKYLGEKIGVLQTKRDKLKKVVSSSGVLVMTGAEGSNHYPNLVECVKINPFPGGVEISIDSGFDDGGPPLSDLLEIMVQEGCNVVSCVSSKINGRLIHSIRSQVDNLTSLDQAGLQLKLNATILLSKYNSGMLACCLKSPSVED